MLGNSAAAKWRCQPLNYAWREKALLPFCTTLSIIAASVCFTPFFCKIIFSINLLFSLSKQCIALPSSEGLHNHLFSTLIVRSRSRLMHSKDSRIIMGSILNLFMRQAASS